ncbi:MAG: hypothetical protein JXA77_01195 [Bacteroidales bacterium]|nr:hypothetical protein [Bacteroidales bacterium]
MKNDEILKLATICQKANISARHAVLWALSDRSEEPAEFVDNLYRYADFETIYGFKGNSPKDEILKLAQKAQDANLSTRHAVMWVLGDRQKEPEDFERDLFQNADEETVYGWKEEKESEVGKVDLGINEQ